MLLAVLLLASPLQASSATTAQPAPAVVSKPGLDTPIETLMADPKTKAVIDADLPKLAAHPSYEMFKAMSLHKLVPMSNGALTEDVLKKVAADLAAVK